MYISLLGAHLSNSARKDRVGHLFSVRIGPRTIRPNERLDCNIGLSLSILDFTLLNYARAPGSNRALVHLHFIIPFTPPISTILPSSNSPISLEIRKEFLTILRDEQFLLAFHTSCAHHAEGKFLQAWADEGETLIVEVQITELLFDCDNTLVLSEELAFVACADLSNELLESKGISDRYTGPQLMETFVGQNFRGVVMGLQKKHGFTLEPKEVDDLVGQELGRVIATLKEKAQPCVGVDAVLEKLHKEGKYGLAVVSSSALSRVQASLEKVGQDKYFAKDHVFSAATSLPVPTTKPDPAIYLHACEVVGKKPGECVAVEDSKSGATSGIRAGIPVIGYVGSYEGKMKQKEISEMMNDLGVKVIMEDWADFEKCLAKIEAM